MIEVDQISLGVTPVDPAVGRIQALAGQRRFGEAAEAIFDFIASPAWLNIERGAYEIDGIILPHSSWNIVMAILLQAYAFEIVADHIRKTFKAHSIVIGLKTDSRPTVIDIHFNHQDAVFFIHSAINQDWMGFAASRFIGILPMLLHTFHLRRFDGYLAICMLDNSSAGSASFSSDDPTAVLLPDPIFVESASYYTMRQIFEKTAPLAQRDPRAMWRGSTTGTRVTTWKSLPRIVLCEIGERQPDLFDCGVTNVVQCASPAEATEIASSGLMRAVVRSADFANYALHIDIDGNSNSWPGLFSKLLSGGAVLKVQSKEGFRQWYYDRLKPWLHYIPVASDMSDLVEKVRWAGSNHSRVERIAQAGQALARSMTLGHEMDYAVAAIEAAMT